MLRRANLYEAMLAVRKYDASRPPRASRGAHIVIDHALLVSLGMTPDQAYQWIAKTAALYQSCGCRTGAGFMVATLLLYPLLWYWVLSDHRYPVALAILVWLIAAFVAGGVGKSTALLVAHVRIRVRLRDIRIRVKRISRHG
jgi:hypothetical protein